MELIIFVVIFAAIGYAIDGGIGAVWGGLLGPLGLILAAILKGKTEDNTKGQE